MSEDWLRYYLNVRREKVKVTWPIVTQNFFLWLGYNETWSSPRINSRASIVHYINDRPLWINSVSEPVLFAGDNSVIISVWNFKDFCSVSSLALSYIIKIFAANNLVLNLGKMNRMKFITKNSSHSTLHIGYKEKYIKETMNTKFLGLKIVNHINWKNHIMELISKLSGAYYAIRLMVHLSNWRVCGSNRRQPAGFSRKWRSSKLH